MINEFFLSLSRANPTGARSFPRLTALLPSAVLALLLSPTLLRADPTWVYTVQISAVVQAAPPQITLNWEPDQYGANSYTIYRKAAATEAEHPSALCKVAAVLSLALWFGVGVAGRAIGFV